MATNKKAVQAAPEPAQEPAEAVTVSQDPEAETPPEKAREDAPGVILGPEDPEELLGCMEDAPEPGDTAKAEGILLPEYAVIAPNGLNLRESPGFDAPVIAVLPCGVGVLPEKPIEDMTGWAEVRTGFLSGWVLARYLAAVV